LRRIARGSGDVASVLVVVVVVVVVAVLRFVPRTESAEI